MVDLTEGASQPLTRVVSLCGDDNLKEDLKAATDAHEVHLSKEGIGCTSGYMHHCFCWMKVSELLYFMYSTVQKDDSQRAVS